MHRRFRQLSHDDSYYPSWLNYRRRVAVSLLAFLGAFALPTLAIPLCQALQSDLPFLIASITAFIVAVLAGLRCAFFPCPRCKHPFAMDYPYANSFTRHCLHCGLEKYSPEDDRREDTCAQETTGPSRSA